MYGTKSLDPRLVLFLIGVGAMLQAHVTLGADQKDACLAAADAGQSLRDDGQYSIARDQFLTCAREVCPKIVHDQCTTWLHQLEEAIPTVVFSAKDDRGNDISAVRVISDGKLITSTLDGKPLPLDPGGHDIRFERDPNGAVTVHVILKAGEKNREVLATFPAVQGEPPPEGTPPPETSTHPPAEEGTSFLNARNVTALSLVGAGAIAIGVGVPFGLNSQSENTKANSIASNDLHGDTAACYAPVSPKPAACATLNSTRDVQNRDAILNYVFYIAGAALAVGGVATWLLWPKKEQDVPASTAWVTPTVGPGHAGLAVGGAF
jgi:hypothetical protein